MNVSIPNINRLKKNTRKKESGITLIVVLVLLVSMSVLVVGTSSDTNVQFKMVRNDQFYSSAYLSAYSEINAQLGDININDANASDEIILDLIEMEANEILDLDDTQLKGPQAGKSAFEQQVSFELTCDPDLCPSPPGYTISEVTKVLRANINSRSKLTVSSAESDQTQAIWYLLPQSEVVTFK